MTVTRRVPFPSSVTSSFSSLSRPSSGLAAIGRLVASSERSGENAIPELVELLGASEVLQPVQAEIGQREPVAEERARPLRDDDLAAVCRAHHARGAVDVDPA